MKWSTLEDVVPLHDRSVQPPIDLHISLFFHAFILQDLRPKRKLWLFISRSWCDVLSKGYHYHNTFLFNTLLTYPTFSRRTFPSQTFSSAALQWFCLACSFHPWGGDLPVPDALLPATLFSVIYLFATFSFNIVLQIVYSLAFTVAWSFCSFTICKDSTSSLICCSDDLDGTWTLHNWVWDMQSHPATPAMYLRLLLTIKTANQRPLETPFLFLLVFPRRL